MVLIKSIECGKKVSNKASISPNCGFPIKKPKKTKKHINKKILTFVLSMCVIALMIPAYFLFRPSDENILIQLCNVYLKEEDIEDILGKCETVLVYDNVTEYHYEDIEIVPGGENSYVVVSFDSSNNLFYWFTSPLSPDDIDILIDFLNEKFRPNDKNEGHYYVTNNDNIYGEIIVDETGVSFKIRKLNEDV